jgi:hypothetical protein
MNEIFAPLLRKHVLVFMDDILIYSKSREEHMEHLREVFSILRKHHLLVKKSKCSFVQPKLEYLRVLREWQQILAKSKQSRSGQFHQTLTSCGVS